MLTNEIGPRDDDVLCSAVVGARPALKMEKVEMARGLAVFGPADYSLNVRGDQYLPFVHLDSLVSLKVVDIRGIILCRRLS